VRGNVALFDEAGEMDGVKLALGVQVAPVTLPTILEGVA
jgi:hypothetical protein